jgi:hypothetical protein
MLAVRIVTLQAPDCSRRDWDGRRQVGQTLLRKRSRRRAHLTWAIAGGIVGARGAAYSKPFAKIFSPCTVSLNVVDTLSDGLP